MSDYYHDDVFEYLADDCITIRASFDVPVILLGDFNSRVGTLTDIEYDFVYDETQREENPSLLYFETHDLINRVNKDTHLNNNGKKLIELCKMSDLKIANGRMGKDRNQIIRVIHQRVKVPLTMP